MQLSLAHAHEASYEQSPSPEEMNVTVTRGVTIPMRDGVVLSTDIYRPTGYVGMLPVILIRTPYDKLSYYLDGSRAASARSHLAYRFARKDYAVAVQDVRGKFESGGEYQAAAGEVNDGYDSIEWLARQSWSNGSVGTIGCSVSGDSQVMAMKGRPPHLMAAIPQGAGTALGSAGERRSYSGTRKGGALELGVSLLWFRFAGSKVHLRPGPLPDASVDLVEIERTLPVVDQLKLAGAPPTDFEAYVSHEINDPWWAQFEFLSDDDRFDTPALQVGSWYDSSIGNALYQFNLFKKNSATERTRANQFFVVAPTTHCAFETATEHTRAGMRDVGDARFDYIALYQQWFDHWLKGVNNRVTERPKLFIYVMGANRWRSEGEWPLARTRFTKLYLHSGSHANGLDGDGSLSITKPGLERVDSFTYDPAAPVPTLTDPATLFPSEGGFDQRAVEARDDVLVYTTPPLTRGVEVTGPLSVVLYVSSSAKDTDFTAKLVDVYPSGEAYNLRDGILRARYREGFMQTVWMAEKGVYKIVVDLDATSNYFAQGHQIRLEVSSSSFPRFDRNLNTGGRNFDETTWVVAHNSVHHSTRYPSHIVLPLIPSGQDAPPSRPLFP